MSTSQSRLAGILSSKPATLSLLPNLRVHPRVKLSLPWIKETAVSSPLRKRTKAENLPGTTVEELIVFALDAPNLFTLLYQNLRSCLLAQGILYSPKSTFHTGIYFPNIRRHEILIVQSALQGYFALVHKFNLSLRTLLPCLSAVSPRDSLPVGRWAIHKAHGYVDCIHDWQRYYGTY